jgi:hypothetical protein
MTQLHEGKTFEQLLEIVERVQLLPCPCVDATGMYTCNRPSTVFRTDYESPMCGACSKERP